MTEKKILIIQTAFLGDAILTLPMIQELKKSNPASEIDVVSIPSTAEVFRASPYVKNVFVYDKRGSQKSFASLIKFILKIRSEKYSWIISPHRSFRTSLIVFFSGVKNTTGFSTSAFSFIYKNKVAYNSMIHEVARNLTLIGADIENNKWKIQPEINIPLQTEKKIYDITSELRNRKIISIAPGSVWFTKVYPKKYFEELVKYFINENFSIALIGGASDVNLCEDLKLINPDRIESYAGKLSVVESIQLIKISHMIICNDSAPTHMGMAAGTRTITLYCSTVPEFGFYPYLPGSKSISLDGLKCKPCGIHGHKKCPINTFDCANNLLPEFVVTQIKDNAS